MSRTWKSRAKYLARAAGEESVEAASRKNWPRRYGGEIVALHGCGALANVEEAAARMAEIRQQLAGVDPDFFYNADETGLLYRCLPSRSYVVRDDRRQAWRSKVMRSKDRVTFTLCSNATGSHKLPVTMIGKAAQPVCFVGQANLCPLPYYSPKSAWTDTSVFKMRFHEVCVAGVRTRMRSPVFLFLDNLGCHSDISDLQVTIIELPSNTTAVYQPIYAGVIAALKRRYKFRLLQKVVANLDGLLASGEAQPQVPRGGWLDVMGQAHERDAALIIEKEWRAITAEHLANCWLKTDVLPIEAAASVRRQVHGVVPAFDNVHTNVSDA
eukprot:contig_6513_g1486